MRSLGRKRVVIVEFKIKNHYNITSRRQTGGQWAVFVKPGVSPRSTIFETYILDILQVNSPHPHPFIDPPPSQVLSWHKRVENKEEELWPETSHDAE